MIHPTAFIHPEAIVLGDVVLGAQASVWPTAVIRGDSERITVGEESNVQDGAVLHADPGMPCTLGAGVTIGHRAIVHGATVGDGCLIGMGAIVLNGARIGRGSIIGAGALCPERMEVPEGSLVLGVPGRVVRPLSADERARIARGKEAYVELARRHRAGEFERR